MRFKTFTLGCKVNQYETQYVRTALLANGYEEAPDMPFDDQTELVVVNTCSVTSESDAKSRKTIAHAAKYFPNAKIYVMGCSAAANPKKIAILPHVAGILTDKRRLDDFLTTTLQLTCLPRKIAAFDEHARAFVKIQDGCRVGCAYCIIPRVRPYLHSRRPNEILDELALLCDNGYREIVLTGIHLGHYGLDFTHSKATIDTTLDEYLKSRDATPTAETIRLATLLEAIAKEKYPARFRLGSLEATEVTCPMLDVIADNPQCFCPHFHLSMQSGDDVVLKAMRRRQNREQYRAQCLAIKERIPNVALTTDVIVGFPGETDEQFLNTCRLVEELGFSKVHVFRYSARPGTVAAGMPNQILPEIKKERAAQLTELAARLAVRYAESFIGKRIQILLESHDHGFSGTSEYYLPAKLTGAENTSLLCGQLITVEVERTERDVLLARCLAPIEAVSVLRSRLDGNAIDS